MSMIGMGWRRFVTVSLCLTFLSTFCGSDARTAQENLDYMNKLSSEQGAVIIGNDEIFSRYVKSKHSKYSVVSIFNAADPKHGCEICQEAKDEFAIAANSYDAIVAKSERNIFFVVLDYDNSPQSFMKMRLNHAPEIVFFTRNHKKRKYDIAKEGIEAKGMLRWLHEVSGVKVPVKKPIPWVKLSLLGVPLVLLTLVVIFKPCFCIMIVTSSTLWGLVILLCVIGMTSGQMWNFIRNASNYGRSRNGGMQLIMGSENAQYRYESYCILLLNAGISLGFILLNQASELDQKVLKKAVGFIGLGMVIGVFGFLISVFRMKSHGYPYYLIFE